MKATLTKASRPDAEETIEVSTLDELLTLLRKSGHPLIVEECRGELDITVYDDYVE
jgi:hypothetical protein